jgi:uncharacterized phage infection (PIP) family protein YhgE
MADLVVKDDLKSLADDLNELINQFQGATDFQNDYDGIWGQSDANQAMGDFANNWSIHRDSMVSDMQSLHDKVTNVNDSWDQTDQQLHDSLTAG